MPEWALIQAVCRRLSSGQRVRTRSAVLFCEPIHEAQYLRLHAAQIEKVLAAFPFKQKVARQGKAVVCK